MPLIPAAKRQTPARTCQLKTDRWAAGRQTSPQPPGYGQGLAIPTSYLPNKKGLDGGGDQPEEEHGSGPAEGRSDGVNDVEEHLPLEAHQAAGIKTQGPLAGQGQAHDHKGLLDGGRGEPLRLHPAMSQERRQQEDGHADNRGHRPVNDLQGAQQMRISWALSGWTLSRANSRFRVAPKPISSKPNMACKVANIPIRP